VHAVLNLLPFQDQVTDHEELLFDILVVILALYNKVLGSTHTGIKPSLLRVVYSSDLSSSKFSTLGDRKAMSVGRTASAP
jgi:hypothetical protein